MQLKKTEAKDHAREVVGKIHKRLHGFVFYVYGAKGRKKMHTFQNFKFAQRTRRSKLIDAAFIFLGFGRLPPIYHLYAERRGWGWEETVDTILKVHEQRSKE